LAHPYIGPHRAYQQRRGVCAFVLYQRLEPADARAVHLFASGTPDHRNQLPTRLRLPANSPFTEKDFEFVEIQNTGTNVINLVGAHLGGGIDFTFTPNLLVTNGNATSNNFDGGGTPFVASTLAQGPGAYLTNDGPAGNLLRLIDANTNIMRNRIAFNQTATAAVTG
jgi:hypothetical protein